jgi:hypothetical protein
MKASVIIIISLFFIIASGCKKNSSNPASGDSQYSNKLTLGTGVDYSKFLISGEGTSFYKIGGSVQVFWRLESANDMAGSNVNIKIEKQSGGTYLSDTTFSFANPQSYGHIMISSFIITKTGNFRATGVLTNGNTTVASKEFTVQ